MHDYDWPDTRALDVLRQRLEEVDLAVRLDPNDSLAELWQVLEAKRGCRR